VPDRLSQLFVRTLREDPADAEVRSHKLLVRAGYIRRAAPGIFTWLPLGLKVRRRIEKVIREEMANAGAQEVFFPALLPKEPYELSGRWKTYGDGIFRLTDRKGADYLLAPTHEEMFTLLVKDLYSSYKDLPLTIYQIQDKYRDEARPRAGLLRGREFSMKDAYSFDVDDAGLDSSYQKQRDAYERIFQRLGIEYVIVNADNGLMGGAKSEEFLHPTPVGEDLFVRTDSYAANVEAFVTTGLAEIDSSSTPAAVVHPSPNTPTIETLVDFANANWARDDRKWTAADTLKNVVLKLTHPDESTELVVVAVPGDREADLKRIEVAFAPAEVATAEAEDFKGYPQLTVGYIGPWSESGQFLGEKHPAKIRYFADPRVVNGSAWITGANAHGHHAINVVAGRDFTPDGYIEVAEILAGDQAPDGSGPVEIARGMEIGHVFQLGRFFADVLGLQVLDQNGKLVTVTMGSYGIGVTRLLAILAEENNDEKGLIWPKNVAPYDVQIVAAGKDDSILDAALALAGDLESAGFDVLVDDRAVSPGVKFADAEIIGVPSIVIVGRRAGEQIAEFWDRSSGERKEVNFSEVAALI